VRLNKAQAPSEPSGVIAQEPRFSRKRISGELLVHADDEESRGTLCDLSEAGAGATDLQPPVRPGRRVELTLIVGIYKAGPIEAEVVWSDQGAAGFQFSELSPEAKRVLALSLASFG
jgi:hypothetical protein